MAINNTVTLTGNLGAEAEIIDSGSKAFAAIRLATTDSYQDKETEEWKERETVWHKVITFNPTLIELLRGLKTGSRIEVIGSLSYRPYKVQLDGREITKQEASVIARKIDMAPLPKRG